MLTDIQLLKIKNAVMRILHVPGNYNGGILEMAVVVDYHMPGEQLQEEISQIADVLKRQNEIFRNVRVNLIKWISDETIVKEVSSLPALQMGRGFEDCQNYQEDNGKEEKSVDELFRQLKIFYARSKIVLVLPDGKWSVREENRVQEYLHPFLVRKLLMIQPADAVFYGNKVER